VTEFTPSGIYEKSHASEAAVPGVNVAFETTEDPELTIDSERVAPTEAAKVIVQEIRRLFDGT
jgi:adenylylsulfate kinase-like enzyme